MSWENDPIVSDGQDWQNDPIVRKRSVLDEFGRQAGLTVRAGAQGLAGLAGIPANAAGAAYNLTAGALGAPRANIDLRGSVSDLLTRLGLPQPESNVEQFSGAVGEGMTGGGGAAKLAGAIPATARTILAASPFAQTVQAGIGGGAAEVTRQSGGGPVAQMVAGAVAPMVVAPAVAMTQAAGRGARELLRPTTGRGQEQVAADVLGRLALDKTRSISNLSEYNALKAIEEATGKPVVGVQGSKPTAGAVSADYGLIGAQQLLERGAANPDFAQRYAINNQARLNELAKLKANPEQVAAYVARRETLTGPLRENAFDKAKGPVDLGPVAERVGELIATPAGGRAESTKALRWITDRLEKYANEGRNDPRNAYALHQDIGDLVAGKITDGSGSALRLAGGLANDVKKTLATQIDAVAPGFKKYLETYSRLSKPIDRLEAITGRLGGEDLTRVTNATPLVSNGAGAFPLSQAKMRNAVADIGNTLPVGPRGLPLAPRQSDIFGRVMGELNADTLASRGGKMPGSDTYQNMATANFLSGILGDSLGKSSAGKLLTKPLQWIYGPTGIEGNINDAITRAFLDPKEMERLLRMARSVRKSPTLLDAMGSEVGALGSGLLGSVITR
jgi:hypothetical protein